MTAVCRRRREHRCGWREVYLHATANTLACIRDIRSSEQRVYLRVREILTLAADYQPAELETQVFFQTIQNKLSPPLNSSLSSRLL